MRELMRYGIVYKVKVASAQENSYLLPAPSFSSFKESHDFLVQVYTYVSYKAHGIPKVNLHRRKSLQWLIVQLTMKYSFQEGEPIGLRK